MLLLDISSNVYNRTSLRADIAEGRRLSLSRSAFDFAHRLHRKHRITHALCWCWLTSRDILVSHRPDRLNRLSYIAALVCRRFHRMLTFRMAARALATCPLCSLFSLWALVNILCATISLCEIKRILCEDIIRKTDAHGVFSLSPTDLTDLTDFHTSLRSYVGGFTEC